MNSIMIAQKYLEKVSVTQKFIDDFLTSIIKLYKINTDKMDINSIKNETIVRLPNEILFSEFLNFMADHIISKSSYHPDYNKLASVICVYKLHYYTLNCIKETASILYNNVDNDGKHLPIISSKLYNLIIQNAEKINNMINYSRDCDLDYFGVKTLERSYLLKIHHENNTYVIERPQQLFMRVALGIHDDNWDAVYETYQHLSLRYFTHATPTLFNAGTNRTQLASCYLMGVNDSMEGILEQIREMGMISKWAGGIGIHMSNIRGRGSIIRGTNGKSEGIIPLCNVINKLARYVNQGGKRSGSIAIYLEVHHPDIYEFCELRKQNSGNEDNRARDLFLALWVCDLFMKRVENDDIWSLMCPDECPGLNKVYGKEFEDLYIKYENEKKYKKQVRARDLWKHIIVCQIESGLPYMCYKDNTNHKSNQKNIGTIMSSNLCVHEDTMILTKNGYSEIKKLENKNVEVWNGEEWSDVTVKKTGTNKNLIRVNLSNNTYLDCTPEHKFYIQHKFAESKIEEIEAQNLTKDNKLIKMKLPSPIKFGDDSFKYSYMHGFFCGDRTTYDNYHITDMPPKFEVPLKSSINTRLRWFEGYCDADGIIARNGTNESIQVGSIHKEFLVKVRYMLHTLGVESTITKNHKTKNKMTPDGKGGHKLCVCKEVWRLLVSSTELYKLSQLGFSPKRLKFDVIKPNKCTEQFVKVVSVEQSYQNVDTYCFTEPKRHMGIFNGILTGQCSEIMEYSDENETAVCNLASICLPRFIEYKYGMPIYNYEKLQNVTRMIVRNLNKVIDINYYPTEKAKKSNMKHRPIGIGVQGLHNVYNMFDLPFESNEAVVLNKKIFETIYYAAVDESKELAKKDGAYETFNGSPFSEGKLQYHLWNMTNDDLLTKNDYDWSKLVDDVKQFGTRNSLITALMPTASSSQIMKNSECMEPFMSNMFVRTTLAGEFFVINERLVELLEKHDLWSDDMRKHIILNNGSIQNIDVIPVYIKNIFKTAFEIGLKNIISQSADRGPFIDQSQSMNLFMNNPNYKVLTSAHFYGWKRGLKTGMYYLRSLPAANPLSFGVDVSDSKRLEQKNVDKQNEEEKVLVCQRENGCVACGS